MVLGDNGLINKAQSSVDKYQESAQKEQNLLQDIEGYMKSYELQDNIPDFTPCVKNKNGIYITVEVPTIEVTNSNNIIGYVYIIDGEVKEVTTKKEYMFTDLEMDKEYSIQVMAIDKTSKTKYSNTIKEKTLNKLYLYNKGNEFIEFTGGFIFDGDAQRATYNKSSNATIFKKGTENILFGMCGTNTGGGIRPKNLIDLTKYKKLCVKIGDNIQSGYMNLFLLGVGIQNQRITDERNSDGTLKYWVQSNEIDNPEIVELNLNNISGTYYCSIFESIAQVNNVYWMIDLREMWLE